MKAGAGRLAGQLRDALTLIAARANGTVRPVKFLQVLAGFVFVAVNRIGEIEHVPVL